MMSPNPNPAGAGLLTITYHHPCISTVLDDHFPRVSPWVFAFWSSLPKCKIWVPGSKLDTPIIGCLIHVHTKDRLSMTQWFSEVFKKLDP